MATKKSEKPELSATNVNNNTNNLNVAFNVEKTKSSRRKSSGKTTSGLVSKTIIIGVIGLVLSLVGYYVKKKISNSSRQPAVIENGAPPIKRN